MTKGTAGFMHAKGTSAISLRPPDASNGLPSPCGECPYCRKFLKAADGVNLPLGRHCPCRICMIINEGAMGGPTLLRLQTSRVPPPVRRIPSEVGMFCEHCNQAGFIPPDGRCTRFAQGMPVQPTVLIDRLTANVQPNSSLDTSVESLTAGVIHKTSRDIGTAQQQQQAASLQPGAMAQVSSRISLSSLGTLNNDPLCRICHSTADTSEELMTPCRCSGTLQHVHMSCLIHWLDISSRKLRKPPVCELCHYRYKRRKIIKWGSLRWPSCRPTDKCLHFLFIFALLTMFLCAIATIVCFQLEKKYGRYNKHSRPKNDEKMDEEMKNMIEIVTLVGGVLFFVGFFVAMYAEIKAHTSIYKYVTRCWNINHEWVVDDYKPSKDSEYVEKLHELRNKASCQVQNGQAISRRRNSSCRPQLHISSSAESLNQDDYAAAGEEERKTSRTSNILPPAHGHIETGYVADLREKEMPKADASHLT